VRCSAMVSALVLRLLESYSVVFLDYPRGRNKAAGNARSGIMSSETSCRMLILMQSVNAECSEFSIQYCNFDDNTI
jgi:hypothetical protein